MTALVAALPSNFVLEISLQILKICVRLNRSPDSKVSFSISYDAGVVLFGGRVMI
jgi:hypothetical protein